MMGSAWDLAMDSGRLPEDVPNWWRMVMEGRLESKGIGSMPAQFMAASFRLVHAAADARADKPLY